MDIQAVLKQIAEKEHISIEEAENRLDELWDTKKYVFKSEELEQFVHDHIQSKIDHNELGMIFKLDGDMNFEEQMELYQNTLLEGLINGIIMTGNKVEGIELN